MKDIANPNDVRNKMLRSHKKLVFNEDLYIPLYTQKQIEEFTRTERFFQQQYGYDTCEYEAGLATKKWGYDWQQRWEYQTGQKQVMSGGQVDI